ncbi:HK97 gp10 family phage protein [uncultured Thermomonospora sp.]|uniref:HK97 gp10 family phage protein n=1 Tax=uncultured Thermomonospora sp. TaxID=671175 RepID=UPI00338E8DE0
MAVAAARARYRPDIRGFGRVLASRQMQEEMRQRAERVARRARELAPVDTGEYARSFRVEVGVREGPRPRAVALVINDDVAAPYVEWGTSRTPRYRVMGRAAESAL